MSMIGIRGLSGYSHWKLFAADCNQVAGPLAASAARALAFAFNGRSRPHSPFNSAAADLDSARVEKLSY